MSVVRVCAAAAHMNAHITINTPAIHALDRVIVVVLSSFDPLASESLRGDIGRIFGTGRILARRRQRSTHLFDGPSCRHAELDR
jgi:hypothetical protein